MSNFADELRRRIAYEGSVIAGRARENLERALKAAAPVGRPNPWQTHEPGMLRDSVAVNVRFDESRFTFHAEASAPHASFTETGTSAHPIVALRSPKKILRFDWPRGGLSPAFFPHVQHPGTTAQHWWSRTLERWPEILQGSIR